MKWDKLLIYLISPSLQTHSLPLLVAQRGVHHRRIWPLLGSIGAVMTSEGQWMVFHHVFHELVKDVHISDTLMNNSVLVKVNFCMQLIFFYCG